MARSKKVESKAMSLVPNAGVLSAWGAHASKYKNREVMQAVKISTQGRIFSIGGNKLGDGKEFHAVILQFSNVKKYYSGVYVKGEVAPPDCFALSFDEDLLPHENASNKQAESCAVCANNKFGTSQTGKGKACADARRLVLLVADELAGKVVVTPDVVRLMTLEIPPTGLKNWKAFYNFAIGQDLPPAAYVVKISFDPASDKEIVLFEPVSVIENAVMVQTILGFLPDADKLALRPWQVIDNDQVVKPSPKTRKSSVARSATNNKPAASATLAKSSKPTTPKKRKFV